MMSDLTVCLAACVRRARTEWPGFEAGNERYWHVREKCVEIARANKIKIVRVIEMSEGIRWLEFRDVKRVRELSAPMWPEVIHPDVLCEQVHSS